LPPVFDKGTGTLTLLTLRKIQLHSIGGYVSGADVASCTRAVVLPFNGK
jgi:hypothetical protein